ncbi:Uncharacterised protein [Ectopseudomonas mendocina]|uniref:Uncharacterized protein n=1 Tax=Ectopseudomonas mendocina TaxID=300 RepID=A0A379PNC4_ECTME|nr:hypothetical protein [Pseudomonas mendocina]SUE95866.1 Uncharacterised protein [Pseudomonas mendocina]
MSDKFFKGWFIFVGFMAFMSMVGSFVAMVYFGSAAVNLTEQVKKEGLNSVIEQIKCGEKGCK